jgi:ribonuclease HI
VTLRIHTDGAARGNPGPAGAGAVLLDGDGNIVARAGRFLGRATNNVAEYEGVLLGLRHAAELGATDVEILTDSELLVRQIAGRYRVRAPHLKPLFEEVQALLRRFERHAVRHVRREENAEADAMANRAIDERLSD